MHKSNGTKANLQLQVDAPKLTSEERCPGERPQMGR